MTIEAKLDKTNELLEKILLGLGGAATAATVQTAPAGNAAPKVEKPAKEKPVKEKAVEKPVEQPKAADEDFDSEPEAKLLTKDDARKALVALQKAKESPEASRGVLTKLGLPSLAALKDSDQEKIKAIIDGCAALMPK